MALLLPLLLAEVALLLLFFRLCVQFARVQMARGRLPPGPAPFPVIGSLWALRFQLHPEILMKLAKVYGNTFTAWLGPIPMVVLNGYEASRDALISKSEEFSGRPATAFIKDFEGEKGVISSNGHHWKQQRRFSMLAMRTLGLGKQGPTPSKAWKQGKQGLEVRIQEEARHLVDMFAAMKGKAMDPTEPIIVSVSNVISAVTFGHRFSLDDKIFHHLMKATQLVVNLMATVWGRLYDAMPWLMRCVPGPHRTAREYWRLMHRYIREEIQKHQETWTADSNRDFIDLYLTEIAKTSDDPTSTFNEESMVQVVADLFLAGSETTTTALRWALLYMVMHTDVQDRVQKELEAVLGNSQTIFYEDRERLPYTNAVIHEIQRYSSISAVGVPRMCVKEATLQGYQIKKGTIVLTNLTSILHDQDYWEKPNQFNPGHFLDHEGNFVTREAFLPFSAGHRVCLGEKLARMELFIFFTSLLRAFTLRLPESVKEARLDYVFGAILQPYPYMLCAIPRLKPTE